ncbi:MAG TPA: CRISPR-associated endonuclease Cas2 [Thermoanaerobaculia bacterium]|nr:CRISPR-associated endonuclease Cas2 [Thermoanaerobaculia bacterium]
MLILVSYDIPDDPPRVHLAQTLEDFGQRVQYSVFECRLEPDALESLRRKVDKLIDPEEDSVLIYRLCRECDAKMEIHGTGKTTEDPRLYFT